MKIVETPSLPGVERAMPDLGRAFEMLGAGVTMNTLCSARGSRCRNALPGGRSGMALARRWFETPGVALQDAEVRK